MNINLKNINMVFFFLNPLNLGGDLKKRYRDLMKIYHPDNQAGDTKVVQQIHARRTAR